MLTFFSFSRSRELFATLMILLCFAGSPSALADDQLVSKARKIGVQAYIYGLPIVLMDRTVRALTRTSEPGSEGKMMNVLRHAQALRDYRFRAVVRPNNDTLPSSAFLDLRKEPMVLSLPEVKDRYFSFAFLDAWTNSFTSRGSKDFAGKSGIKYPVHYLITGPEWEGQVPDGLERISAPTNLVWILGRTEVRGAEDLKTAILYQKQYSLVPFSKFGTDYKPLFLSSAASYNNVGATPKEQVHGMSGDVFFSLLLKMIKDNPPPKADNKVLSAMKSIGLDPDKEFDFSKLPADIRKGLDEAVPAARVRLRKYLGRVAGRAQWGPDPSKVPLGAYGTRYFLRAIVADVGLGALKNDEAVYQGARKDSLGRPLIGSRKYVIHFKKGMTPPVNAFWSVSLYDQEGYYVDNPIHRYKLGSNSKLSFNKDGSLDLYIQNTPPPNGKMSNWLPSPKTQFNLNLRMYAPKGDIINGKWKAPPVMAVE